MGALDEILAALPQDYQNMYIASAFFFGLIMTVHTMRWAALLMEPDPRARGFEWDWLWDKLPREYVPEEKRWRTPWAVRVLVTTSVMGSVMTVIFLVSMYWVVLVVPWMLAAGYFLPMTEWACDIVRRGRDDVRDRGFWERAAYGFLWFPMQSLRLLPEEALAGPEENAASTKKTVAKTSAREVRRQRQRKRESELTSSSDTDSGSDSDSGSPSKRASRSKEKGKEPATPPQQGKKKKGGK